MAKITIIIEDFEFPQVKPDVKSEAKPTMYTESNRPEYGELVLVRDIPSDPWMGTVFHHYEPDVPYPWLTGANGCAPYAECAKYDASLVGIRA